MSQTVVPEMFSPLPEKRAPWVKFVLSCSLEIALLALLGVLRLLHPEVLEITRDYHAMRLVDTPAPVNQEPAPVQFVQAPANGRTCGRTGASRGADTPADCAQPRRAAKPAVAEVAPPPVVVAVEKAPSLPPSAPVTPRPLPKTNNFSSGSSQIATIVRAPEKVQTGGFGDPNGIPAREGNGKPANIAQKGSFDLPSGPGYGNGTGGEKGVRGVVASAGFGNGVAIGDGGRPARGVVRQAGFQDVVSPLPDQSQSKRAPAAPPKLVPAEILWKPLPVYTQRARDLHIEGEVLLEVVFEATGKLRVVKVVSGLGNGLDEAAVRSAEQIRFKPALQDGLPADWDAVVHVIFQLT